MSKDKSLEQEIEVILEDYKFASKAIDEDLVLQQDPTRVERAHQHNLKDVVQDIKKLYEKRERLVRKEELDRLFTTKRINGDQIVNQATFNYILDRIGELNSDQLKQTSIKEREDV